MHEYLVPFTTVEGWISLVTLILMEIVLGIDNIIFIALICGKIPDKKEQSQARTVGLSLAMLVRIILLMAISWIAHLTKPMLTIISFDVSGRDLILFAGGVFLVIKTLKEIRHKFNVADHHEKEKANRLSLQQAIIQITLIDIVFSFDSIITAVGLSNQILVMIIAVVLSMFVMLMFAPYVSDFINNYPTLKMLALVFLIVIGGMLIAEGLHQHVDKSYVYIAMAFALVVEVLNIRLRNVHLKRGPHGPHTHPDNGAPNKM